MTNERFPSAMGMALCLLAMTASVASGAEYLVSEIPGDALAITNNGFILLGTALWNPAGTISNPPRDAGSVEGWAVNSSGVVAGLVSGSLPGVWSNGSFTALPTLPLGPDVLGEAYGINDSGVVVGLNIAAQVVTEGTISQPQQLRAVRWTNGVAQDLSSFLGDAGNGSFARAVNNSGTVVIDSNPEEALSSLPTSQSYLLNGNAVTSVTANDGSSIGISAWAINDDGEVAGTIYLADDSAHAFTWQDGHMTIAPSLSTSSPALDGAMAISESGEVVGISRTTSGSTAFVWDGQNAPVDLNTLIDPASGWQLTSAWGVNADGDIVGNGLLNGTPTGFLLTPTSTTPAVPTPEPTTLTVSVVGMVAILRRREMRAAP